MRLWVVLWSIFAVVVVVFTVANWSVLTAQTTISLIVTQMSAPLGLLMLGAMAALTLLFLLFLLWVETKALVQLPRPIGRAAADTAKVQGAELRTELERQLTGFRTDTEASLRAVLARFDRVEQTVRDEVRRLEPQVKRVE
jgi:hypothetical protein